MTFRDDPFEPILAGSLDGGSLITTYRKNASYCLVKAASTQDAEDQAKWLEFADMWERLADREKLSIATSGSFNS